MIKVLVFFLTFLTGHLLFAAPAAYDAIAKIRGCSASLIQFYGQKDNDKVLLLTNGHCVSQQLATTDAIINRPHFDIARIYRGNVPLIVGSLNIDHIVYATLTDTDVAILRTTLTYGELKEKLRLMPRRITSTLPAVGDRVTITSGNLEQSYRCQVDGTVEFVKEDKWQWHKVTRLMQTNDCDIVPGASGSPVLNSVGNIVAIINTGNLDGKSCILDNPCEVNDKGQSTVRKGAIYATRTEMLNACFPNGELTFTDTCELTKPQIKIIHSLPLAPNNPPHKKENNTDQHPK